MQGFTFRKKTKKNHNQSNQKKQTRKPETKNNENTKKEQKQTQKLWKFQFLFIFIFFSGDSSRQFVFFWWYVFDSVCFFLLFFAKWMFQLASECLSTNRDLTAENGGMMDTFPDWA